MAPAFSLERETRGASTVNALHYTSGELERETRGALS